MTEKPLIQVHVNGQTLSTVAGVLIPEFLQAHGLQLERVVVEYNGIAQTREESAKTALHEGDQLEVVRIVAGG
jgi:sulfur carrier protein